MQRWPAAPTGALALAVLLLASPVPAPAASDERAADRLYDAAERLLPAVLLVGQDGVGHGTAFVLSREHRLLATAAHVADAPGGPSSLEVVAPGTGTRYRVARLWYHPRLTRALDDGLVVRSADPADGPVVVPGLDVAVLQLAPGGPPLPAACALAPTEELVGPLDGPVGLLGYWDSPNAPPEPGRPPAPRIERGIVARLPAAGVAAGLRPRIIAHTALGGPGGSGGPLFRPDGRVVGVYSAVGLAPRSPETFPIPIAVRADALIELLAYHDLDHLVPIAGDRRVIPPLPRRGPDPNLPAYRRAAALLAEARTLTGQGRYGPAGRRCNEALRLAPGYSAAFLQRSRIYAAYVGHRWRSLPDPEKRLYARWAADDAHRCLERDPGNVEALLIATQNIIYLGCLKPGTPSFQLALKGSDLVLTFPDLDDFQRSFATNCRAQARQFLGDIEGALADYNESIRLAPDEPTWYANRAKYWERIGHPARAARDRSRAEDLARRRTAVVPAGSVPP